MILDLIVVLILTIPMAIGFRRGLVNMFMRTFGWVAAIAAGFFLKGTASEALEKSPAGHELYDSILCRLSGSADEALQVTEDLPEIMRSGIVSASDSAVEILARSISAMVIGVLSFIIIVLMVKLILSIFVRSASHRRGHGLLNTSDRLLGMAVGCAEGILLVFLFLAALVPVVNFGAGEMAISIRAMLGNSYIASTLYDNNLIFAITGGLFS